MSAKVPPRIAWAVERLGARPDHRVLEVGCGTGVAAALLAERVTEGRLLAIDRSASAVARTRARVTGEHVEVLRCSLAAFLERDERFDRVLAVNVNVFWTAPDGPEVRGMPSLLADGGMLLVVYETPGRGHRGPQVAAEALRAAGLQVDVEAGPSPGLVTLRAQRP